MTSVLNHDAAPSHPEDDGAVPFIQHFIAARRVLSDVERWSAVMNPTTGIQAAATPLATAADVDTAVQSAHEAFTTWSAIPPIRRARVMFRFKDLLEQHTDELAQLIAQEHGKVLADARGEVQRGIEVVEFCCGIPHLLKGEFSENIGGGIDSWTLRQPLGVCAGITPFNFPVMVPLWMLAPAIACGNTFVLKPSEKDPSSTVRLAELLVEAGAPAGVLNVIHGDRVAVDALLEHPLVHAISFVGSTPIAKYVYETGAAHGKRVQSMGGAKNHLIVMPDADLDQVVDGLMGAAYGSAGERCMAISVAVAVGDAVADKLVGRLTERVRSLNVGGSTDDDVDMGPLVTAEHRARVLGYVERGVQEGATLVVDGRTHPAPKHPNGFFVGGCLFDHVTAAMSIYQEEIFGPVLCVVRANSFDEAIELASSHPFGNGVSIYTRDGDAAREFVSSVQVGMVGINVPIPVPMAFYSFGGWKQSAFGDLNQHGMDGVRFFTKTKTVTARWPTGIRAGSDFSMPVMK